MENRRCSEHQHSIDVKLTNPIIPHLITHTNTSPAEESVAIAALIQATAAKLWQ